MCDWAHKASILSVLAARPYGARLSTVALLIILAAGILLIAGCGSSEPFEYVKVRGKVTYDDGTPLPSKQYQLRFQSEAPAKGIAHPLPAQAVVVDGKFDFVTSHKYGDGLVPGKHKVMFAYATDANGKLLVPPEYTEITNTPLEVDTANSPLDIKVPKPSEADSSAKTK